jgi:hypothetical protein
MFNTGLNQSTVIECEGFDANPNVTQFSLKGPLATTEITRIFGMDNKFTVVPRRHQDFGVYECYMRNEAGGKTCEVELRLGGRPNPPTNCAISYNKNSNKTAAQINCKIGYNQGGSISEFIVYERLNDGLLRHSGSVSIHDSTQTDFGYLTKEIDEHAYYEFVVMQRNNYGNSTEVLVSIGTKPQGTHNQCCPLVLVTKNHQNRLFNLIRAKAIVYERNRENNWDCGRYCRRFGHTLCMLLLLCKC